MSNEPISIRIRLKPEEIEDVRTVQEFLGLPSLSQTFTHLGLWNAHVLAASLRNDSPPIPELSESVGDVARLATAQFLKGIIPGA